MSRTEVIIDILVNSRDSAAEMDQAASKFGKFGGVMEGLAAPAGIALGAIGGMAAGAAKAASDMQQSSGGVDAVFKSSADAVHGWATSSAEDVGLASSEYQTMAAGIGGALSGMGVPMDQAAQSTHDLMLRSADLASVFGGTTAQAADAVNSAFRGEFDSLQRLIPSMNAAAVEAEMAAEASAGQTFASQDAAKAAAITKLIMDKSADSAGNFAKESDTAAGAQAIAQAQFQNTAAALGEQLLPALTTVMGWLTTFGTWISEHITLVTTLAAIIAGLAVAVLAVNAAMAVAAAAQAIATAATAAWSAAAGIGAAATTAFGAAVAFLTSPVFLVVAAIAAVIAIVVLLVKNWDTVSQAAQTCWDAITSAVGTAVDWIKSAVGSVVDWLTGAWRGFGEFLAGIWDGIKSAAGTVWEFIKSLIVGYLTGIQTGLDTLKNAALAVWDAIKAAGTAIWDAIKNAAKTALEAIMAPINAIKAAIDKVISGIKSAIQWAGDLLKKVPFVGSLFGGTAAPSVAAMTAGPTLVGVAPRLSATRTGGAGAGGITINVTGALDPVGVAKQIRALLVAQDRRGGGVTV